ncbi:MAG TPA: energy transducer TonB [Sedimentisphaerales bacterium]|nr:energy transducer TonB [Sedimentisphaerales bacterium]
MGTRSHTIYLEKALSPRWTVRAVLSGIVATAGVYFLLPYLEVLSQPPARTTSIRSVDTAELPPPPPPPPQRAPTPQNAVKQDTPKPKLQKARHTLTPLRASMNLQMALGDVGGDFSVDFGVDAPALTEQVRDLVFELADLDEKPRPLMPLRLIYPSQARIRKLEGIVVVEFIVLPDGGVRDTKVISSQPGEVFNEAAVQAVERWRFAPGTKEGKPVSARVRQKVEFRLH